MLRGMCRGSFVVGFAIIVLAAGAAQADYLGTVDVGLVLSPADGAWQVIATDSPVSMDGNTYALSNGGIASFSLYMHGYATAVSSRRHPRSIRRPRR